MTTPEEYALKWWQENQVNSGDIIGELVKVIRQAVAAEREACARLAEELYPPLEGAGSVYRGVLRNLALELAAVIRARGDA